MADEHSGGDAEAEGSRRYRAPALEKGLDVLELLSTTEQPLTLSGIVARLGRSHGELFRMVQVLQFRGYLEQDEANEGYRLTDRLFSLGMQQPRTRSLIEAALPFMRRLAIEAGQSCHLAVHSRGEIVVVARMESSEQLGFSVRVGYRKPLVRAASGAVLYAFQPDDVRRRWEKLLHPALTASDLAAFRSHADEIRARQVELTPSAYVSGVTDISAPVMRGGVAAAALTMPYLTTLEPAMPQEAAARAVSLAAAAISQQLVEGDSRV